MDAYLTTLVFNFLSVSCVSSVHVVYTLACILLGTLPACDEVDTILTFAGEVGSDPVGFSSIAAHESDTLRQPGAQLTSPSPGAMLVLVASSRL